MLYDSPPAGTDDAVENNDQRESRLFLASPVVRSFRGSTGRWIDQHRPTRTKSMACLASLEIPYFTLVFTLFSWSIHHYNHHCRR